MSQWKIYEEDIERHCQWFRKMEAAFRDVEPRVSLENKMEKFKDLMEKRAEIVAYERIVDDFIDQAHALLQQSGVARIKPQISQMSSR
jgi:hypothetical protein